MWGDIETDQVTIYNVCYPRGVKRIIATGSSAFVGEVDESTVLKYPLAPGKEIIRLETEKKLLEIVGPHERIIGLKGVSDDGLYLERAAAEAVAFIHSKGVLHCDIQPTNLLLYKDLHIKLSDSQGRQLAEDGTVLLDGCNGERTRFYCPRADPFDADIKTDIFALGCTVYMIMMGHPVFPDIVDGEKDWFDKVRERFEKQRFPEDEHLCSSITSKCWMREYESTQEVVQDLEAVEQDLKTSVSQGEVPLRHLQDAE